MVLVHEAWRETTESDAVKPQAAQPYEVDPVKSEEMLVQQARQGDPVALVEIYETHMSLVYSYFYRRVPNVSEAEDLTSETFLRAFHALSRGLYEPQGRRFLAWLLGVAKNVHLEWLRGMSKEPPVEELDSLVARNEPGSEEPDLLDSLVRSEEGAALWQLVEELPLVERSVLVLRHVYELSYAEIAERLDRSEVACKQIHYRALKKLRQKTLESQL